MGTWPWAMAISMASSRTIWLIGPESETGAEDIADRLTATAETSMRANRKRELTSRNAADPGSSRLVRSISPVSEKVFDGAFDGGTVETDLMTGGWLETDALMAALLEHSGTLCRKRRKPHENGRSCYQLGPGWR